MQLNRLLPKCKTEQQSFVSIKNHKCASDTTSVVFCRFGYDRNVSFAQHVDQRWAIGWPQLLQPYMYRASKDGKYNIITDHAFYNESNMSKIMAPETKYITSLREPFEHLKSSFHFFWVPLVTEMDQIVKEEDRLLLFLQNKDYWDNKYTVKNVTKPRPCVPPRLSVLKNMMSFDLELPLGFHDGCGNYQDNITYIHSWLKHLDDTFEMVVEVLILRLYNTLIITLIL